MKQIDPKADKIFYNGKIVTVDKDFRIEETVAIKGDRFVAIGSTKDVLALAGPNTEKIDLGGKTAVPGFIDTHPHLAWSGLYEKALQGPLWEDDPPGIFWGPSDCQSGKGKGGDGGLREDSL
jgi:predicted amidohydrolase YtcJ